MAKQKRLLILGGTGEARTLAERVAELDQVDVITSLAGRTRQPGWLSQNTRIGGFGGVLGLVDYLKAQQIDVVVDATHPFAAQISFNAAAAAAELSIPHVMWIRPAWKPVLSHDACVLQDIWIEVDSNKAAATVLPEIAQRIFLTIGRQELTVFADLQDLWFLMRMIDPPMANMIIPPGKLLLERGPFSLDQERWLLQRYEIGAIVSKNSGGDATYAKLIAARELRIPVVMVQRPPTPSSEQVETLESALAWITKVL
jgi:precorrin-6A/cobalt-precorrin-6A reductase